MRELEMLADEEGDGGVSTLPGPISARHELVAERIQQVLEFCGSEAEAVGETARVELEAGDAGWRVGDAVYLEKRMAVRAPGKSSSEQRLSERVPSEDSRRSKVPWTFER